MKKILVVNNNSFVHNHTVDFAIRIAIDEKATLFGLFLKSWENSDEKDIRSDLGKFSGENNSEETTLDKNGDYEKTNIRSFVDKCSSSGVPYKIHIIQDNFLDSLIDHSAFADLIVCDGERAPSRYSITTLIAGAHCPVLLVNRDYRQPEHIVFAYDDNLSSSIHAIKIFTYLFRSLHHLPVHFISVVPQNVIGIQYEELIREWLPLYFPSAEILIVKGEPKEQLTNFINAYSNPLVIMGSFGRSSLSRFFKESLANSIIEKTNAPIFIAHD